MSYVKTLGTAAIAVLIAGQTSAQDWVGSLEAGLFSTNRTSTNNAAGTPPPNTITDSPFTGVFVATQAQRNFGDYRLSFDARLELTNDEGLNNEYLSGPLQSGIIGLHFGREFGNIYFGGFAAAGYFDGFESQSPMSGTIIGLEGAYSRANWPLLFAQIGAVEAVGSTATQNEFDGYAARFGTSYQITDDLTAGLSAEIGLSEDCFVDCGDQPGAFQMIALDARYAVSDQMDIVMRYSDMEVYDAEDDDTGTDRSIYIGARWNFGAPSDITALTTPMGGFQASGWMHPLD